MLVFEISVLIPYKPDHGPRDEAFRWVSVFYQKYMPFAEVCLGHSNSTLFSRAQAINDAAQKAKADLFLIADNDIFYDPNLILEAKAKLKNHAWIILYTRVQNIQEECTKKLLQTDPAWPLVMPVQSIVRYPGSKGGLTLIPRKHFEAVNGFDERFVGWGGEDDAFAYSVDTICGQHHRLDKEIYHLWHPNSKKYGNPNYENNYKLFLSYSRAKGKLKEMEQLILSRGRID
jgi:predicted glycosyltransferase involved in capsule biosynthesis